MMENMNILIVGIAATAFLYPVLHSLILWQTENVRLEFADIGRALLQDTTVDEEHKILVSEMLDDVFDWRCVAYATFAFPFYVLFDRHNRALLKKDHEFVCRPDACRFFDLHLKGIMAASPIWAVIFLLVSLVTIIGIVLFFGMSAISMYWTDTVKHVSPNVGTPAHKAAD